VCVALCACPQELYKNLMFVKNYDGDVENDLCLTFSYSTDVFGHTQEIELIPGGSSVAVTSSNRLKYV
jgi:ubiquitin-protein ligase E3 C